MAPGPRTKALSPAAIGWLKRFRVEKGYSMPQLNRALASPFKWRTLQRAIDGFAISEASHGYIMQWLERFAPGFAIPAPVLSGKDRGAGETEDSNGGEDAQETARTTGPIRRPVDGN